MARANRVSISAPYQTIIVEKFYAITTKITTINICILYPIIITIVMFNNKKQQQLQ